MQSKQNLRGNVFNMCVRKVLLHGSKTWPFVTEDVKQLVTADSGMIRWICGVSLKDCIPMTNLSLCFGLNSINGMLRWNPLRFQRHLIHTDDAWPKKATMHYTDGRQPRGRPRKRLCDVIHADMTSLHLSNEDANSRAVWRRVIRQKSQYNMQAFYPHMWILNVK